MADLIDSTIIEAHRAASGAKGEQNSVIGVGSGGRTTRIHMLVDDKGRPLHFVLTLGMTGTAPSSLICCRTFSQS